MATYTPIKPYGLRWGYRTPSPPPSSVIEPISPVEKMNDSAIIFPIPPSKPNHDGIGYQPNPSSHEEPRSDSTLSLLSSVSPPSASSRQTSPNTMGRSIGSSEVPTFAGNQYWDPLAFFADVALSSADPTTLPKLQKLAAKDAAQRMEASPAEVPPLRTAPEDSQNSPIRTTTTEHISRRLSTVSSLSGGVEISSPRNTNAAPGSPDEPERIDLAPMRDITPPSSNASMTGNIEAESSSSSNKVLNGLSVSSNLNPVILPSPPLGVYTRVQQSNDDGDLFSDSPAKRSKTTSQHNSLLSKNPDVVESSTNTEGLSAGIAQEQDTVTVEQSTHAQKGKRKGRGGKAVAVKDDPVTAVKKDASKTKKGRAMAPANNIAVRRSTRNIKYIEEPEEQIIARLPAKVESQNEPGFKQQAGPQRIVLHVARNHLSSTTKPEMSPTTSNDAEIVGYSKNTTEQLDECKIDSTVPNALGNLSMPSLKRTSAEDGTPAEGDTAMALGQLMGRENRDRDVMSIVDQVQKQLMLSGSISGRSENRGDQIGSHTSDPNKAQVNSVDIIGQNVLGDTHYMADSHPNRNEGGTGSPDSTSFASHNRKSSIDAQAIVDALQQAPPAPQSAPPQPSIQQSPRRQSSPLMDMTARQLWSELRIGKMSVAPAEAALEEQPERASSAPADATLEEQPERATSAQTQQMEHTKVEKVEGCNGEDNIIEDHDTSKSDEGERFEVDKQEGAEEDITLIGTPQQEVEVIEAYVTPIAKSMEEFAERETSKTVTLALETDSTPVVSKSPSSAVQTVMDMGITGASHEADISEIPTAPHRPENTARNTAEPPDSSINPQDATAVPTEGRGSISIIHAGVVFSNAALSPVIVGETTEDTKIAPDDVEMVDAPQLSEDDVEVSKAQDIEESQSNIQVDEPKVSVSESAEPQYKEGELVTEEPVEGEPDQLDPIEKDLVSTRTVNVEDPAAQAVSPEVRETETTGIESSVAGPAQVELPAPELGHTEHIGYGYTKQVAPEFPTAAATPSPQSVSGALEGSELKVMPRTDDESPNCSTSLVETVQPTENIDNPSITVPMGAPETPPNNDLCLVCNSSTFIGTEANSIEGQASAEATLKWIECDNCKRWTHNACVNLSNEEVDSIDKYHCASCEKDKGPSTLLRKSARARAPIDYESLNNGSAVPVQSATNKMYHPYVDKILNAEFKTVPETFPRVVPEELSLRFFEDGGGFKEPIVIPASINPYPRKSKSTFEGNSGNSTATIPSHMGNAPSAGGTTSRHPFPPGENNAHQKEPGIEVDALGMGFPDDLTVRQIVDMVGPEESVEVIDVKSQSGDKRKWTLARWAEYFDDPNRDKIYNVISLEVSSSRLARLIQRPKVVREMDLSDQVWPKDKRKEFPAVQYYCLMSVAHSYTDWHVDFGGSSVYYRILRGRKVFFFLAPTKENLVAFQQWNQSPEQHYTWLAEGRECFRIDLGPGDTMLIPSGWMHAVYTPEDSLVIGGNFLTRLHYPMQFRIHEIERATGTPVKYRFPRFARVHWYDTIKLMQEDPIPKTIDDQLVAGKAANFRSVKGKGNVGNLSIHFLEGLPAVAEFLRRNSLIAQEIITEGLTKQKTEAVRAAIPKGFDDGWDTAQSFARWVTWKRNCGEIIPPWAHPDADPAEGVPNAGQRKISAAAIRHAERLKADADRRAAGAVRSGLRERNQSIQPSSSGASETPAPEEARNTKKRPRLDFGDTRDLHVEPPRKKSRSQKERLDQDVIDECVEQVVAEYEKSSDATKAALAVEVRTQYRNVHITRLGPSRSACAPCRDGKTKCTHKDEIRALTAKVLDLYHTVKGTPNHDRPEANADFLGEQTPQPEGPPVAEHPGPGTGPEEAPRPEAEVLQAGPSRGASKITQVVVNLTKGITPKVIKRPQNRAPRPKKGGNESGEPRRRGGKRTACDACRKSRRKCSHGLDGSLLALGPQPHAEEDAESDDDRSAREATTMPEVSDGNTVAVKGEPAHASAEEEAMKITTDQQAEERVSPAEHPTPSEQLRQENDLLAQKAEQDPVEEVDRSQLTSSEHAIVEDTVAGCRPRGSQTSSENTTEDKGTGGMDASQNTTRSGSHGAGRGKRKRAADTEEAYVPMRVSEGILSTNNSPRRPQVTPSPSSSRRTKPGASTFDDGRGSPKKARVDESEASPKGNRTQNTPEKQAWQENKAAEFGLRKRSKSKSSS